MIAASSPQRALAWPNRLAVGVVLSIAGSGVATLASPLREIAQTPGPPTLVRHVPPVYPESARARGLEGTVVVEATLGPDGKVREITVVQSIPELDAAAVDAVRQWEYTPTLVNGVAVPVLITVTVNFTLSAGDAAAPPLVLTHDGGAWRLNGQRVPDGQLERRLDSVLQTRAQKRLFVQPPASLGYAVLIAALADAVNAGVEHPVLVEPGALPESGVEVWLETVRELEPDLRLPAVDVLAVDAVGATRDVRLRATGDPDPALASAFDGVAPGVVVRLHVDGSRRMADVWPVLRLGKANGVAAFALAVVRE